MSLLDTFTGGKSDAASEAMRAAREAFSNLQTPTQAQLTLPELQQYVQAGIMTPAQAQSYLQESNAFNTQNIPQTGTAAQVAALNQLSGIANAGAEGTPVEQAQIQSAINKMNTAVGGQRGAIEQGMAARGTPAGLIQAALANQTVGQEAQQANESGLQAQAQAYQTALNAMTQGGALGGQLQGQQNQQANTVAQAQNAMQQFNAQNQQQAAEANAGRTQQANAYNTANKQDVSNQNTGLGNYRTEYNTKVPQQVFNNALSKASGEAGAYQNAGNLAQQQGQQNAGLWSGLLNTGATIVGGMYGGPAGAMAANQLTKPSQSQDGTYTAAHGALCMDDGGMVPGEPEVMGDSEINDKVPILASPGEAVLPRSAVSQHLPQVLSMLAGHGERQGNDPQDVATLLRAMKAIRQGAA